jgi:2-methylcitrate dehydratase PrpD
MSEPLLAQLARRLSRRVGERERVRARLHLLDWLACVAGARQTPIADVARKARLGPLERASLLGNMLEMDDIHRSAILHPGPAVWPAALADHAAGVNSALDAAVRGYEAMIAVGAALDAHHYAHWHPTGTMGGIGAAAASASLLDLDQQATGWALSNAASVSGGFWHMRHADVLTKQWHVLHAVRAGRGASDLAAAGLTGATTLLEGPQGLFAGLTREPRSLADAGECWLIGAVSFKPWAACRHCHPTIDCALELRERGELAAPFVVETFAEALAFCDRPEPKNPVEAKFSLQHALAVVADGRNAEPQDFSPAAIEALSGLRAQVTVAADPDISARFPRRYGARVNGFELVDTLGDPERPLGEGGIVAKLQSLVDWGGLPNDEAERARSLALQGTDVAPLHDLLTDWLA